MLDERPISSFDEDLIGFEDVVESLATHVRSTDRHGDLYAVFGPWGSGKTSFLKLLATKVEDSTTWIEFDALRHQATEDVLTALVAHVGREAMRMGGGNVDIKRSVWRTARALSMSVADIALRSVAAGLKFEDVKKHLETAETLEIPESPADALRNHMELIVETIIKTKKCQTVVVAVDNLDRCRPDAALRFIEALLVFNEVPHLRLIVAADRGALIGFVNNQFAGAGFDGALYLEKIFPYSVIVPNTDEQIKDRRLISKLLASMSNMALNSDKADIAGLLHAASATRNPRRAKRILRRFERLRPVASDKDLYAIMMGIVLAETWPALYEWFWVCSKRSWLDMVPEIQDKGGGTRPKSATDQSQEFLREIARRLGPNITELDVLRRTITQHRSVLDI
jgi:hypothetical protein